MTTGMEAAQEHHDRFVRKSIDEWSKLINSLFSGSAPTRCSWHDLDEIVDILNKIGTDPATNHLFFPKSGGLDVTSARRAVEADCIEIHFGGLTSIIKPEGLYLETFEGQDDHLWSYFRIETKKLAPTDLYDEHPFDHEELTEISRGEYAARSCWDYGTYGYDEYGDELPLPEGARPVSRHFCGAFVIFAKGSLYNMNTRTYDGRHNKMNAQAFRKHIEDVIEYLEHRERERGT